MDGSRISRTIHIFNAQITSIDNRLQEISADWGGVPRYVYLDINPLYAAEIHNRALHWQTDLYPKYQNPLTSHLLRGTNGTLKRFMDDFRRFTNPVLDMIAASDKADITDERLFNIVLKRHRKKPSRREASIHVECSLSVQHHGSGAFRCQVRVPSDSIGRANIPRNHGADAVELAYHILPKGEHAGIPHPDSCRTRVLFTRALFTFHIGAEFSGHWVQLTARWVNSRHPHLAGSWSETKTVVIP